MNLDSLKVFLFVSLDILDGIHEDLNWGWHKKLSTHLLSLGRPVSK